MLAINALLLKYDPDIICLQEITHETARIFLHSLEKYYPSTTNIGDGRHYGELIFSKYPIIKFERFPFRQTSMLRHVNIADICIPVNTDNMPLGHNFTVVTAHLESLPPNRTVRREQMMGIFDIIDSEAQKENAFFLGDTNFLNDEEFSPNEMPQFWSDVWQELANVTKLIDSVKTQFTSSTTAARLDRVFVKSVEWIPTHLELVGTEPIDALPSDHYGIFVRFSYG